MRITSLRVQRYGSFEDLTVGFGPGATVIFGPNEAGKSTLLDALGDFLWGIKPREHPRAYRYVARQMLLEGCLEVDGTAHTWSRRLGRLVDQDQGEVRPPWDPERTGDPQAWLNSFGLDLDRLQEGGKLVIAGKGDLADLIFLAETGLVIDKVRQELKNRRDTVYKDRKGAGCDVRTLITDIEELEARVEGITASASAVVALRGVVTDLHKTRESLSEQWVNSERTRRRLDEQKRCFGSAARLREAETQLSGLTQEGPTLGSAETQRLGDAIGQRESAAKALDDADRAIKAAQLRRSRLTFNADILEAENAITTLQESLVARRADQRTVKDAAAEEALRESVVEVLRKLGSQPDVDISADVASRSLAEPVRDQLTRVAETLTTAVKDHEDQRTKMLGLQRDAMVGESSLSGSEPGQVLVEVRTERDTAWTAVRDPWLSGNLPEQSRRQVMALAVDETMRDADRMAESQADQLAKAAERRGQAVEREHQIATEQAELERLADEKCTAQEAWQTLVAACGLATGTDPDAWKEHNSLLTALGKAWAALEGHSTKVEQARHRLTAFSDEVAALVHLTSVSHSDPVRQVEALVGSLNGARESRSKAEEIGETLAGLADRRAEADLQLGEAEDAIKHLTSDQSTPVLELHARSKVRADLVVRAATLSAQVRAAKEADSDMEGLLDELAGADLEQIEADRSTAASQSEELKDQIDLVNLKLGAAQKELSDLESRDSAADLRAQTVTKGEILRARVDEYRELSLQLEMLDAFARHLADSTESPVLDEAGRNLARLTRGRFVGFAVLKEGGKQSIEVLYCDPLLAEAQPTPVALDTLSEGTADQVFLALRLAGIKFRQAQRTRAGLAPLPVVLDDVLMAHDDDRTGAALDLISEATGDMQIILLTHHRSVLQAAEEVAGLTTVELSPVATPASA